MRTRLVVSSAPRLLAIVALTACATDQPTAPTSTNVETPVSAAVVEAVPGAYLIGMRGSNTEAVGRAVRDLGGKVRHSLRQIGTVAVAGLDREDVAVLRKRSDIARIDPDRAIQWLPRGGFRKSERRSRVTTQGTDQSGAFFYPAQWNLQVTDADDAWATTNTGAGRKVCVLDSGIDAGQADLVGRVFLARTMISVPRFPSDLLPEDFNGHGTLVASIVSSNGLGMASVAPDASICSLKVLSEDGVGTFGDVIAGIIFAGDIRAHVINMSLSSYPVPKSGVEGIAALLQALQSAIDFATSKGSVVVAASGNDGVNLDRDNTLFLALPAQLRNVVSVGATGPDAGMNFDRLAPYSNHGGDTGIDLVAPGGDLTDPTLQFDMIIGACSRFVCGADNFYLLSTGTSVAAPHVSGAAAVVGAQMGGTPSPAAVVSCILTNTDVVGPLLIFGRGRLNVDRAAACESGEVR